MYIGSFKYYLLWSKDTPELDRGLGIWYLPVLISYLLLGLITLPIYPFKNYILFKNKNRSKNKFIEFVFTENQLKISNELNIIDSIMLNFTNNTNFIKNKSINISNYKLLIITVFYGFEVFYYLIKALKSKRVFRNSTRIIRMIAIAKVSKFYLKGSSVFIQYNDHALYNVMLECLAKKLYLKTVYIQHAPVSYLFPPLYHDLNVLFSEDSIEKYKKTTGITYSSKNVLRLCDFRFPEKKMLKVNEPKYILICFNELDSLAEVEKCALLFLNNGYKVKLRPHPADKRVFKFGKNFLMSSKSDSIWSDLSLAKCVIVNESAVPLESLFYGVPTYKLSLFYSVIKDNYNFLSKGLLNRDYDSLHDLMHDIISSKKTWNENKLSYFLGNIKNKKN